MPTQHTDTQVRLNTLITYFAITVDTLQVLANSLKAGFLESIAKTTRSLLNNIEIVEKNKETCIELMEQTHELLNAIIILHVNSDTSGILPPSTLNHIGKFTGYFFFVNKNRITILTTAIQDPPQNPHLCGGASEQQQGSLIPQVLPEHLWYDNFEFATDFINFIPDEQGLFSIPKQVGWGRPVLQEQLFIMQKSLSTNKIELAALIGAHLDLKPSKDLTQAVSIISLLITMRGAERPAKVRWSHPFLLPLQPLKHHAAQQTFIDITEDHHNPEEVDRVLSLTDNMPLAINLIAHLVDVEEQLLSTASESLLFPATLQTNAPLPPDPALSYSRDWGNSGDLSWLNKFQFMTDPQGPIFSNDNPSDDYFPFDPAAFLSLNSVSDTDCVASTSALSEPDAMWNTHGIDLFEPLPSHDDNDTAGIFHNAGLDNSPWADHFPELQLPTFAPPAPSSPGSPLIHTLSPIEALNAEQDPRNIVTSARARNPPKRTLDDHSTVSAPTRIKAKKQKTKRVDILFSSYYFVLLKSVSATRRGTVTSELHRMTCLFSVATDLDAPDESESENGVAVDQAFTQCFNVGTEEMGRFDLLY
ncbi:hypothetical protein B0H13DRAFT_1906145 [Mycena leptocephala]|nr:hypothetical protein B0H13DRAFT_1906145 [Mycena leptocephala]